MAKAKFNIGDRVMVLDGKGIDDYTGFFVGEMKKYIGNKYTVKSIRKYPEGKFGYYLEGAGCFVFDERGLKSTDKQTIEIYRDGKETIGRLDEGGNTVKQAVAKCCPQDRYDFKTGAGIVLDRLFEPESQKYNARLVCVNENGGTFVQGRIYEVRDGLLYLGDDKYGSDYSNERPFKSLKEINEIMSSDFIELKEE